MCQSLNNTDMNIFARTLIAVALMAGSVQSCEIIAWPDLGCEAVRKLVVKDFPLTVLLDTHGGDLYQSGPAAYLASREHNA